MSDSFDPKNIKGLQALGPASSLGCAIVASLLVFIVGGIFLDQWLDTTPVLTLIGVGLGLIAAGYQLWELTLINRKDRRAGPLGRRLETNRQDRRNNPPPEGGDRVQ